MSTFCRPRTNQQEQGRASAACHNNAGGRGGCALPQHVAGVVCSQHVPKRTHVYIHRAARQHGCIFGARPRCTGSVVLLRLQFGGFDGGGWQTGAVIRIAPSPAHPLRDDVMLHNPPVGHTSSMVGCPNTYVCVCTPYTRSRHTRHISSLYFVPWTPRAVRA